MLRKAILLGLFGGVLWWLTAGNGFWQGFVAGLIVNELSEVSPWLADRLLARAARGDEDSLLSWRKALEQYPGKLTKLVGALLIVGPLGGRRLAVRLGAWFSRRRQRLYGWGATIGVIAAFGGLVTVIIYLAPATTIEANQANLFVELTNVLLFVIGAIAVVMLIVGGVRYTVSQGDPAVVTAARNTILYAIIGLVTAFLAYSTLTFVTSSLR